MTGASPYEGFRGAGVRLSEEQLPHLRTHRTDLLGDSLPWIHAFDKAHLVMLAECGLLTGPDAAALLGALRAMEAEGIAAARDRAGGGMHSAEHHLIGALGIELGGRINMGRSSGDLIEVARRLTIREHLTALTDAALRLRGTLLDLAAEHAETVLPGYTHGQHAQPTTFGHWALMFERALARDTQRCASLYERLNRSPAGAAIMTGTDFPISRERVAELLGFDAPLANTMDAILSHDLEMEVAAVYATAAATLSRLADDLFLWSTAEFAFVELPDRYCGTSSIMPQKKNPDALEIVKSVAGQALSGLVAVVTAERGPTGFPILERRRSQDLLWATGRELAARLGDLDGILRDLRVHRKAMAEAAGAHWAQVTDVASALVTASGADWRTSHQVVGLFVRRSIERGLTPATTTLAVLDEAACEVQGRPSGLDEAAFRDVMDARAFVARRTLYGGPAPKAVLRERAAAQAELDADRSAAAARTAAHRAAAESLERAVDALIGTRPDA
ncbi:argininosuccinate lyase [Streptomyces sp. PT12]|uniref:argininosuccinate lyase n=1 Tax=Streptomyces sp. PT12 TaxID=1510197 RepID=UPI000DE353AC|nr:argininosuccinate lyase [Streptomyces sp. PT12]RBM23018.1 argininosuccinate lyase [Streptomyces sp. PT12]